MNDRAVALDSDDALMVRIADGDQDAVRELYARHAKRVYHFVLRLTKDGAAAEDLTNDVFIDVMQKAERFEGRSQVSTWLLAIARFRALSARRRLKNTVDPDDALGEMEDESDTPEVTAQKSSKGERLKGCMRQLSEEHREVIDLVYYQEKSIKEISIITGVSENTVKTRMFYARKRLSALMAEAGIDRGWP